MTFAISVSIKKSVCQYQFEIDGEEVNTQISLTIRIYFAVSI